MHTLRAVTDPRFAPTVRNIWQQLSPVPSNEDAKADDLRQNEDVQIHQSRNVLKGFEVDN
jgi:hypothetical protein